VQGMEIGEDHVLFGGMRVNVGDWVVVDGTTGRVGRRVAAS